MPNAFNRVLTPSPELAVVIGAEPLPRTDVVSKLWAYIKQHGLQDPTDKRVIVADDKLRAVLGQDRTDMFKLMGLLSPHLK